MKFKISPKKIDLQKYANLLEIYDWEESIWCPQRLFMFYYNMIPNAIRLNHINCKKANEWFLSIAEDNIADFHYTQKKFKYSNKIEYDELVYWLYEDTVVYFNTRDESFTCLFRQTDDSKIQLLVEGIQKFKTRLRTRKKPEINVLVNSINGIDTQNMEICKPQLTLEENYNEDLLSLHPSILKRLQKKNDKGLLLLHGKPGTGKTSYIRYLIAQTRKDVIFLPPNMASAITDPGLMSALLDNPNSIFVIEDAENSIMDRNKDGNSAVSTLLNLADGLLSDCLNIQIICTFNTELINVDSALMRKGRLIAKYEFKELEIPKAQALINKLGYNLSVDKPMTLSSIYNQNDSDFQIDNTQHTIGFKTKK
jgi:hypothetical protein